MVGRNARSPCAHLQLLELLLVQDAAASDGTGMSKASEQPGRTASPTSAILPSTQVFSGACNLGGSAHVVASLPNRSFHLARQQAASSTDALENLALRRKRQELLHEPAKVAVFVEHILKRA